MLAGVNRAAGGPAYTVPRLAEASQPMLAGVQVWSLDSGPGPDHAVHASLIRLFPPSTMPLLRQLGGSPALRRAIEVDAATGAVLHTHGLWLMPNIYPAWARRHAPGCRLVHSPRGMLGPEALRISAWKKRPVWWLMQRQALAGADVIHATAESEYAEIRAMGLRNPVAIIPNGIDLPEPPAAFQGMAGGGKRQRTLLSLGRMHPKKGLDRLIRAWVAVQDALPDWRLRLVGPPEVGHDKALHQLALSLGARDVSIEAAVYGDAKWACYREADLFVLPTLNENFGVSVAEALACEVPVISTRGAPWAGLERERCGWWIEQGVAPLAEALRAAAALPDEERRAMGMRGRAWMARDFGWDRIGRDMADVYRWLKSAAAMPGTVRLD
jgi:glycosyltransferase involved in cell wall biosynthesis